MKNELKVLGKQKIKKYEFTGIEGGFGEGKRTMLVKEIAQIHKQSLGEINRRINDNRKRFKDDIDIIDLKANGFEPLGQELGFSKQSFNQSKNIYILSERGYSKLLKLLEDDNAWDVYEDFVDGYFNMRIGKESKSIMPSQTLTGLEPQVLQLAQGMQLIGQVVQGIQNTMANIQEYVKDSINAKDHQIDQTADMIGLRGKNTKYLTDFLKEKLSDLSGRRIMANNDLYIRIKNKIFREFKVCVWEDIPISSFNRCHSYIDSLEKDDLLFVY